MTEPDLFLYVGPTASRIERRLLNNPGITCLPPVRRGDIGNLIKDFSPCCMAIVDGTFHSFPSVGHIEIRTALEEGWKVWGLSSMGAIRAVEMKHLGVQGYGEVYRWFNTVPDFSDDEVALLHTAEPPYEPLSEPLIHIRAFIASLVERKLVSPDASVLILELLKNRWYAERTLPTLREALVQFTHLKLDVINEEFFHFDSFRLKNLDLLNFIEEKPWRLQPTQIQA